jgi:hypothetical protein
LAKRKLGSEEVRKRRNEETGKRGNEERERDRQKFYVGKIQYIQRHTVKV